MNSRERVRRAVAFQKPDRAPISHAVLPAAQLKYGQAFNEILAEFREDFGWDGLEDLAVEGVATPRELLLDVLTEIRELGIMEIEAPEMLTRESFEACEIIITFTCMRASAEKILAEMPGTPTIPFPSIDTRLR